MIRLRRYAAVLVVSALAAGTPSLTACTPTPPRAPSPSSSGAEAGAGLAACPHIADFSCGKLDVPIDRADPSRGRLSLNVAAADNADAPKGVLVVLTGGPGQPGVALLPRVRERISYLLKDYRLVMFDQRGTGGTALNCPRLQSEVGSSDITPASEQAVKECVDAIGPNLAHYTTADTVADLEDLRTWLKAESWTLDGISYGTYVAQRYAYRYPQRVTRMVLDSVVPVQGAPALYLDSLHRTAEVLRDACATTHCSGDPAADVASIVKAQKNGVELFDLIVTATVVEASFRGQSFDPATVVGQGLVESCRFWPSVAPPPPVSGQLSMPVLLLNGERDLSTPLPWAVGAKQNYTNATFVEVPDMGHSVQGRDARGDQAVKDFLLSAA